MMTVLSDSTTATRPAVLLVESRRTSFTESVLGRGDVEVMLLRLDSLDLGEEYVRRTAHVPTFTLKTSEPLEDEAARYLRWVKGTRGLPRPRFFCDPDEALQETAQSFAARVDLPHVSPQQSAWVREETATKDRHAGLGLPHAGAQAARELVEARSILA